MPLATNSHTPTPCFLWPRKFDSPGQLFYTEFYSLATSTLLSTLWCTQRVQAQPVSYGLNLVPLTTNSHTWTPRFLGSRKLDSPWQFFYTDIYFWATRMLLLALWCLLTMQTRPFLYAFNLVLLPTNSHTSTPCFPESGKSDSSGQIFHTDFCLCIGWL